MSNELRVSVEASALRAVAEKLAEAEQRIRDLEAVKLLDEGRLKFAQSEIVNLTREKEAQSRLLGTSIAWDYQRRRAESLEKSLREARDLAAERLTNLVRALNALRCIRTLLADPTKDHSQQALRHAERGLA